MTTLSIREVRKCLTAVAKDTRKEIRNVNAGGCAVYAVALAKRLKALGISDFKLRVYNYVHSDLSKSVSDVEQIVIANNGGTFPARSSIWRDNGVDFCHVRLEWRNTFWDAAGSQPVAKGRTWRNWYALQKGDISLEAIEPLTLVSANWSNWFDRDDIPRLHEIADNHFNKLLV